MMTVMVLGGTGCCCCFDRAPQAETEMERWIKINTFYSHKLLICMALV